MKISASANQRRKSLSLAILVLLFSAGAVLFISPHSEARRSTGQAGLPTTRVIPSEFDVRGMHGVPKGTELRSPLPAQLKALGALQSQLGATLKVQYNGLTATPRHLFVDGGYLTPASAADPESIARSFLTQWSGIFRFSADDLDSLGLKSRATLPDTGTTILLFEQQVDSLPVYHGEVLVNVSRDGRILDVGGESFPQLSIDNSFSITPQQAITSAAAGVNVVGFNPQSLGTAQVLATYGVLRPQYNAASNFSGGGVFTDNIVVEKIVFPTGDGGRLAYKLSLTTPQYYGIIWESIVDAQTGVVLRRISLTSFLGPGGGGVGVGRKATFRPDIQDIVEAYNSSGTAQGKVFDGAPTTLSGPQGFGGSTRTGVAPNYTYTSPAYSLNSADPTTSAGHFRYSVIQARNEHPLMFLIAPSVFTPAQLSSKLSQVQRGFPDAGSPTALAGFGLSSDPSPRPRHQGVEPRTGSGCSGALRWC
jgi:Fungalysin/Thermolysin Propeptide Motif